MQPAAPGALNVPAGQIRHASEVVDAVFGLYLPPLQRVQMADCAELYEPGAHGIIAEAPLGQYVPAVQAIFCGMGLAVPV